MDLTDGEVRGRAARLSPTERRLLGELAAASPAILAQEVLLERVWGLPPDTTSRTLYATVQRLRKKVERDPARPEVVLTVAGRGYQYVPPSGWVERQQPRARHLDDFVGRDHELIWLERWLLGQDPPPLVVHGPDGIGRSRVLAELSRRQAASLGTVAWVDARGVSGLDELCARIAAVVDHPISASDRDRQRLGRLLTSRGLGLLVLDDVDALEGPEWVRWLEAWPAPRPRVVVTAAAPVVPTALRIGPLPSSDARALFAARAGARFPRWVPTEHEDRAIDSLVASLHGVPLAIELVAGPAVVLGADRLAAAGTVEPLAAVTGVSEWVWDHRSDAERSVLVTLSSLAGPTPMDRVAELLAVAGVPLWPLTTLVQDGVLQVLELPGGRGVELAAALREVARRQGDVEAADRAHTELFGAMGSDEAIEELTRHGDGEVFAHRLGGLADLRAAASRPGTVAAQAGRLAAYLLLHLGANDEALRELQHLGVRVLPADLAVWAHRMRGEALRRLGRVDEARQALDQSLAVARASVPERVGRVLHTVGVLEANHGGEGAAEALFAEAIDVHEAVGDGFRWGLSEAELATVHLRRGRAAEAVKLFQRALTRLRALDCPVSEAIYLGNLAVAHLRLEQFDAARDCMQLALGLARRLDAPRLIATNLSNLGLLAAQRDELEEAATWFEQALSALEGLGEPMEVTVTRVELADVARRQGQSAVARRWLDQAAEALDTLDLPRPAANARLVRAAVARLEGSTDPEAVAEARALVEGFATTDLLPRLLCEEGHLRWLGGDEDGARSRLDEAQRQAAGNDQGPRTEAGRAIAELADVVRHTDL